MEEEPVTVGRAAPKRALVVHQVLEGHMTNGAAALVLGRSVRQVKRLLVRYRTAGPAGLVHGTRGRVPWPAVTPELAAQVVELARGRYAGLNQQHFTEHLAADEGIVVGRTTVRRILLGAGVTSARPRRAPAAHRRRERMAQEGMLLQADGSRHHWLGAAGPELTVVAMIDDATSAVLGAVFREPEDGSGSLLVLEPIVRRYGIPQALYVDRHGIFQQNTRAPLTIAEELAGGRAPTQVGRVLGELGIRHIAAHRPQAKGRIERWWGTGPDRLVAAVRLAGVTSLADAHRVLGDYLPQHTARFAVPPTEPGRAYLAAPPDLNLAHVFCLKQARVVRADNTITFEGQAIQLLGTPARRGWARSRVEVHERLDGQRVVVAHGQEMPSRPAPPDAATLRARVAAPTPATSTPPPVQPPPASHPWRQYRRVTHSAVR